MSTQKENDEYIVIPNPIYDVVFKYLMEDHDSATIILSTLINEKIIKLDFRPVTSAKKKTEEENERQLERLKNKREKKAKQKVLQNTKLSKAEKEKKLTEITIKDPTTEKDVKLIHLDFTAVIELENGEEEMVMIELQKVESESDIYRFREYIASNLTKKRKLSIIDEDTKQIKTIEEHYRLIPIFILNFKIEDEIRDLMIKTRQLKSGIFTNKQFSSSNKFIDQLSYEIYVAQLPYLNEIDKKLYQNDPYKQKLYAVLKIFDQDARIQDNDHRLRLARRIFPKSLERILKRLKTADIDNPDLEKHMRSEDMFTRLLKDRDNKISFYKEKVRKTTQELDNEKKIRIAAQKRQAEAEAEKQRAEIERQKAETEKQKAEIERQKAETEKQRAEIERQKAETEKQRAEKRERLANLKTEVVILYHVKKQSKKEIANTLGISLDEINQILE